MKIFKNIIIALDFKTENEQAKIDRALKMAHNDEDISFTLFTVVPEVISDPEKIIIPAKKQEKLLIKHATKQLEAIALSFSSDKNINNKITCLVKVGNAAVEIVKQVLTGKHDLLMISTRKEKTIKEHILGSTTVELMRQCPCPILAVKPGNRKEKNIMIGLHFDEKVEDHNDTLNHHLVRIADSIAEKSITEKMHFVNVTDSADDQRLLQINELVDDISDPDYEVLPVVLEGNATSVLPDYAEQQSIDLLIMGMLSRTGLLGFFVGNTAEKIMDDMNCSILAVKPKEFVSQISI